MIQRKHLILLSLAGAIVSFDQLSKRLIASRIRADQTIEIVPNFFNLTFIKNPGAAFGLLAHLDAKVRDPLFAFVPLITLIAILFVYQRLQETQRLSILALAAIVGGALGNLIDRAYIGFVIDFLDFHWNEHHFPAFNLADAAISAGVFLLLLTTLLNKDVAAKE